MQGIRSGVGLSGVVVAVLVMGVFAGRLSAEESAQKDLRAVYQTKCSGCHGVDGSATNAAGKKLSGQDFTDPAWLGDTRDAAMVKVIQKGKFFGLAMPAYKDVLTKEESKRMVELLRQSVKGKVIAPAAAAPDAVKPDVKPQVDDAKPVKTDAVKAEKS